MSKVPNGFSPEQWTELYERVEWRQLVLSTLHTIATCEHANPREREMACAIWGTLLADGSVVEAPVDGDFRPFPVIVRDMHCSIVRGRKGPLDKEIREAMSERLEGVKQMVFSVTQFKKVGALVEEFSLVPPIDTTTAN